MVVLETMANLGWWELEENTFFRWGGWRGLLACNFFYNKLIVTS